jgi:hypothetical protein
MSLFRAIGGSVVSLSVFCSAIPATFGQIVINELVEDEQDFESATDITDTREFVELYNAGASAVDIGGWTLGQWDLDSGAQGAVDTIPGGSMIGPGDYFVIGQTAVPNVDYVPTSGELWDNTNVIFELKNPGGTLVDAVGVETFRGVELMNATQAHLDQIAMGETAGPTARAGWWGQLESYNDGPDATYPNLPLSLGRYLDGRDNNSSGRDFGLIPATPGTSNNLPIVTQHEVTDVDSVAVGTLLRDDYYASFKLPRVINPGAVDAYNPSVIPASPQGGRAIIAWDETGGGNSVHSDEYTNSFKIYAYINPTPFNNTAADSTQSEASVYGIGTTDPLFATPNSADLLTGQPGTGGDITSSANGSTGVGWLVQRRTSNTAGTQSSAAVLQLINFNDGGDGVLADAPDWEVIETIDLTGMSAGWHVLGVEYDPASGDVTATYDAQEFTFDYGTLPDDRDMVGNFYIGYRENLPGTGTSGRPPTYDLFVAAPGGVTGDYNNNGTVDAADYVVWRKNTGTNNSLPNNSLPGPIGQEHYDQWRANFGKMAGGAAGVAAGVPEPTSVALIATAFMILVAQRKRQFP